MVWSEGTTLAARFASSRLVAVTLFASRRRPGATYRGFTDALGRVSGWLFEALGDQLRGAVASFPDPAQRIHGWLAFAVDGTRIDCPRTASNLQAHGTAGREHTSPQMWLTTLYHLGLGLPWAWRVGRADASERHHLRQMLHLLPKAALLVADAGFTGFELLSRLHRSRHNFLIRVGANVGLLRNLGYAVEERGDTVYLWRADRKRYRTQLPLVLRLIRIKHRTQTICLVTNVLDSTRLSRETALTLYRMRWGVEVFYRSFKQTLERRKMRSHSAPLAEIELHATMIGLMLLLMLTVRQLLAAGRAPCEASTAGALKVIRVAMRQTLRGRRGRGLFAHLGRAVRDARPRRAAKHDPTWPHKKTQSPPGPPRIRPATPRERDLAAALKE